tara:strand:- start:939 stop:1133 length:195 start_codon:yes stop_codon:yes gene_type:complete
MLKNNTLKVEVNVKKIGRKTFIAFDFPSLWVARKNPIFNECTEAFKSTPTTVVRLTKPKGLKYS